MSRSLWMGDLDPNMDEAFIGRIFQNISLPASVKVIRRKDNGMPAGYCFIEFATESEAERVLKLVNGTTIPGVTPSKRFRLNRSQAGKLWDIGPSYSVFVGDLDPSVTDDKLEDFFLSKFRSVKGAKIVYEEGGVSRGYGFVRFSSEVEQKRALVEMQGARGLGSKAIRVSVATPKGKTAGSNSDSNSTNSATAEHYNQQWVKQYTDQYQYYQQYYNSYYNYPQMQQYGNYYQQAQQQQQQQQVANANSQKPEQYNSTAHYQASRLQQQQQQEDKLEDPNPLIDVDLENETYFETHTALLNSLGAHWNFIDTFTSKVPDLLQP
ncbi:tRNA selenocysteine 1-associated protein 1-like isoform X1 [Clavelina lepadiformis]|uniref:tRNA selenocysteine 1-associated protein 1-like isoform X1 n=2 Tax=Clavelina lepadiformis TaxID=159417 RepID=UPI004041309C